MMRGLGEATSDRPGSVRIFAKVLEVNKWQHSFQKYR